MYMTVLNFPFSVPRCLSFSEMRHNWPDRQSLCMVN